MLKNHCLYVSVENTKYPRKNRLLTSKHFRTVFERHKRVSSATIKLCARINDLSFPRLGLVVSRKSVGNAVSRNRIKRLCRESFRHHRVELGNFDIVLIAKQELAALDNAGVRQEVDKIWQRLNAICGK